jgi:hypothetical protein
MRSEIYILSLRAKRSNLFSSRSIMAMTLTVQKYLYELPQKHIIRLHE